jgi:hypothetical protein
MHGQSAHAAHAIQQTSSETNFTKGAALCVRKNKITLSLQICRLEAHHKLRIAFSNAMSFAGTNATAHSAKMTTAATKIKESLFIMFLLLRAANAP